MHYEYVTIRTSSKTSFYDSNEIAVTREMLRRACERFSTQFCDYVELYISLDSRHGLHKSIKYDVTDENRDAVYFDVVSRISEIYRAWA